jgi:restriction system protein
MNLQDAIIEVLRSGGKPMSYNEITARLVQSGLWSPKAKRPEATVVARISTDIKHRGADSPFVRVSRGSYYLRDANEIGPGPSHSSIEQVPQRNTPRATAPQPAEPVTLSFTRAGEKVLAEFGNGHPMHYREITAKALEMGWLETEGKTPEASMYAQILTDNKRRLARGERPRFIKHGRGLIGLEKWAGKGLAFQIEEQNRKARADLLKRLHGLTAAEFEDLIGRLLAEIGFENIEVTKYIGDGGIDVRGTLVVGEVIRTKMAVQAKKWKNNVQAPTVQQVRGSLGTHEQGLIITTSNFSKGAGLEAERRDAVPVALMNGEQLVALLVQYEIGVVRRTHELIELGETEDGELTHR